MSNDDLNPYRPPAAPGQEKPSGPYPPTRERPEFVSNAGRARFAVVSLAIAAALAVVSLGSDLLQIGMLNRAAAGQAITDEEASFNDLRVGMLALAQFGVAIVCAVAFCMFTYRAYRNVQALGTTTDHSPGMAVGYFFIPILNLFRPFQVYKEIWTKSDPDGASSALLGWWWLFWIVSNIVGNVTGRISMAAEGIPALLAGSWCSVADNTLSAIAAVLAIQVVRGVNSRQEEAHGQLASGKPSLPPEIAWEV